MVLGYNNDDGAQALDQQQEIDYRRGWQVVDAASGSNLVTDGTGSYEVDVAAGDINTPTGTVTCSAATLDLQSLVDPDLPRIVIVYRDASGTAQTLAGTPAAKQPTGETAPGPIYQPAPDAFSTTDGVVLATVLLEAAASGVEGAQIRDRRMPASLNVDSAEVGSLNTVDGTVDGDTMLGFPSTSNTLNPSFDSWFQPSADRPTLVNIEIRVETDGSSGALVSVSVDESGGTTADYSTSVALADGDLPASTNIRETSTIPVPAGGQLLINNVSDPNGSNIIENVRVLIL